MFVCEWWVDINRNDSRGDLPVSVVNRSQDRNTPHYCLKPTSRKIKTLRNMISTPTKVPLFRTLLRTAPWVERVCEGPFGTCSRPESETTGCFPISHSWDSTRGTGLPGRLSTQATYRPSDSLDRRTVLSPRPSMDHFLLTRQWVFDFP